MASATPRCLRSSAKSCKFSRLLTEARAFSTVAPARAKQEQQVEKDEEAESREQALRRSIAKLPRIPKQKPGFQSLGENKPGMGMILADEEFGEDDISSLAHAQLEEHRERRQYLRIAAWEMPLLSEMAKPFVPPTSKQPLRFRYTSYLGENHPAERKVVVEFCPADMPLTEAQQTKLVKLLGPRYNPEKQIAKMSSDSFDSQAQNKRYLGDLVDELLKEARDPTDIFDDVPIDTRHHVFKQKPRFPKEWRVDEKRQAALDGARRKVMLLEMERSENGEIVDGALTINNAYMSKPMVGEAIPAMAAVGKQKRGQAKSIR